MQEVLAFSLLAQHEMENTRRFDLGIIIYMLKSMKVNFSALLVNQFQSQAETVSTPIVISGMVTPIAHYLCIFLDAILPQVGSNKVDLAVLKNTRFLSMKNKTSFFVQHKEDHFPLPNPMLTGVSTIEDKENWLMNTPSHTAWVLAF